MSYPYKICDPVHGFIRFGEEERAVIDSRPFQRLRYIRQMGVAYLIYPGAVHTRFEHSLGVMDLATRIYNTFIERQSQKHHLPIEKEMVDYWRLILRLAALCHDLGHLPFSHTAEKALLPEGGHEKKTLEIVQSDELREIWRGIGPHAEEDVIKLSLSEKELNAFTGFTLSPWERVLSQVITEDNFGADRIDYLIRDARYTGVGYGHFDYHQLIDTLRLIKKEEGLSLGVTIDGIQSVESLWIARYMMYARVYQHPKSCAYTNHMRRFMCFHYRNGVSAELDGYLEERDYSVLSALNPAAKKGNYDAACLLKEAEIYRPVTWEGMADEEIVSHLKELERHFGEDLMIDHMPNKTTTREFPILTAEQEVVSSSSASPFLSTIPRGEKFLRLYIHPNRFKDFAAWMQQAHA